jgi:hypothetical protein
MLIPEQVTLCFVLRCIYSLPCFEAVYNARRCIILGTLQCCGETCRLYLQMDGVSRFIKMPEDNILHSHLRKNVSYEIISLSRGI